VSGDHSARRSARAHRPGGAAAAEQGAHDAAPHGGGGTRSVSYPADNARPLVLYWLAGEDAAAVE
jgi:hypothetical protein